jgi:hypothetical protein
MNWKKAIAICGVLGVSSVAARADINYTQETTMVENEQYKSVTVRAVKPNFERYETRMDMGNYKTQDISIRECGKKESIRISPDLKIYAITPDFNFQTKAAGNSTKPANNAGKPTTGKMVMKYTVKDLGVEEVAGFKCHHYMVEMESTSTGCAGDGTTKSKYEFWVSDIRQPNPCPNDNTVTSVSDAMSRPDCKIEVVQQGDFQAFNDIHKGLVIKQIIYNGDKPMMTITTTSLSQAKLGDDLFTVPAGFTKVTPEEFDKQKQAAMMKALMGGNNDDNE